MGRYVTPLIPGVPATIDTWITSSQYQAAGPILFIIDIGVQIPISHAETIWNLRFGKTSETVMAAAEPGLLMVPLQSLDSRLAQGTKASAHNTNM